MKIHITASSRKIYYRKSKNTLLQSKFQLTTLQTQFSDVYITKMLEFQNCHLFFRTLIVIKL